MADIGHILQRWAAYMPPFAGGSSLIDHVESCRMQSALDEERLSEQPRARES
jgi:hypothetical protein